MYVYLVVFFLMQYCILNFSLFFFLIWEDIGDGLYHHLVDLIPYSKPQFKNI